MASASWGDTAAPKMGGKVKKPAKKISHVTVRKGASGGHIVTHHHTAPEHHPAEDHVTPNDQALMEHMQQTMGNTAAPQGAPPDGADPNAGAAPPQGAPPAAAM